MSEQNLLELYICKECTTCHNHNNKLQFNRKRICILHVSRLLYIDCMCLCCNDSRYMKWLFCALHNDNTVVHVNVNSMTRYQIEIIEESEETILYLKSLVPG